MTLPRTHTDTAIAILAIRHVNDAIDCWYDDGADCDLDDAMRIFAMNCVWADSFEGNPADHAAMDAAVCGIVDAMFPGI